jgi:DNA-binding beta-propeller fold protein YncE
MFLRRPAILLISLALAGCERADAPEAVIGRAGRGPGEMAYPRAMASAPDGTFYVVDRAARVQRFDAAGRPLNEWQMAEWAQGKPVGLTVGPDGNLWVPDTHYHRIIVFTPQGQELYRHGTRGQGDGQFDLPTDIAFDSAGNIYVSEYGENNRVQVFDRDWKFIRSIGSFGRADGELARPQSIAVLNDRLYVADACNHRISVFTLDGVFERSLGRSGSGLGEYRFPYGLDVDRDNRLIVCEFGNNRVQKIDPVTGKSFGAWGRNGRLPGELAYPWAAVARPDGSVIVADAGNNRLQIIRF